MTSISSHLHKTNTFIPPSTHAPYKISQGFQHQAKMSQTQFEHKISQMDSVRCIAEWAHNVHQLQQDPIGCSWIQAKVDLRETTKNNRYATAFAALRVQQTAKLMNIDAIKAFTFSGRDEFTLSGSILTENPIVYVFAQLHKIEFDDSLNPNVIATPLTRLQEDKIELAVAQLFFAFNKLCASKLKTSYLKARNARMNFELLMSQDMTPNPQHALYPLTKAMSEIMRIMTDSLQQENLEVEHHYQQYAKIRADQILTTMGFQLSKQTSTYLIETISTRIFQKSKWVCQNILDDARKDFFLHWATNTYQLLTSAETALANEEMGQRVVRISPQLEEKPKIQKMNAACCLLL